MCITCAFESHNHPSAVEPGAGAETGGGGILRDGITGGQGGDVLFTSSYYFGGNLLLEGYHIPGENRRWDYPEKFTSPLKFMIEGSNGLTRYMNPFGKPVIYGGARAGGIQTPWGERRENIKPTLGAGVVGTIREEHVFKKAPRKGMLIVRIGGGAAWVGFGGGSASSMGAGDNDQKRDYDSVQRGDPKEERCAYDAITEACTLGPKTPFAAAHDQGGSGLANMLLELLGLAGGEIQIRKVTLIDKTLPVKAIMCAEWQESFGFLVWPSRLRVLQKICRRNNTPCDVLGKITGDGRFVVRDSKDNTTPVNLDLKRILHDLPKRTIRSEIPVRRLLPPRINWNTPVLRLIRDVFRKVDVGSKAWLVNKGDRSVGGLITQQQSCGALQQPVADVACSLISSRSFRGAASALGEQPWKILVNPEAGGRMSIAEAFLNLAAAYVCRFTEVKLRLNWMSPAKRPGEMPFVYLVACAARDFMIALHTAQNGGKDSSSKVVTWEGKEVKSPTELIVTAFAPVRDTRFTLTPDIKLPGQSELGYIDLGGGKYRLGGSNLLFTRGQLGNVSPDVDDPEQFARTWNAIQVLVRKRLLLSYHDISDGGLIAALAEMLISGNCGAETRLSGLYTPRRFVSQLFAEELGVLFEYEKAASSEIQTVLSTFKVPVTLLGSTTTDKTLTMEVDGRRRLEVSTPKLFDLWQSTSARLEEEQMDKALAKEEARWNRRMVSPPINLSFTPRETAPWVRRQKQKHKVAVIREQGSNGYTEMISIIERAGMEPVNVPMNDLGRELDSFKRFRGMVFVGGFSYRDRFGAGRGWNARIEHSPKLREMFDDFDGRTDTLTLEVCNGCQRGALAGTAPSRRLQPERRPVLVQNKSGKFESRWVTVGILDSPAVIFRKMVGTTFPIWESHGEGLFNFTDESILKHVLEQELVPMVYVDESGKATMQYPCNPNGSPHGIAALCSPDGRRVIMMPHPERSESILNCAHIPYRLKGTLQASPWLTPFQSMREWFDE